MEAHKGGCVVSASMAEESGDKRLFPWGRHVLGKGVEADNSRLDHSVGEEVHGNTYLLTREQDSTLLGECKWEAKTSGTALPRRNKRGDIQGDTYNLEESNCPPEDSHVHVPLISVGKPDVQSEKQFDEGQGLFG